MIIIHKSIKYKINKSVCAFRKEKLIWNCFPVRPETHFQVSCFRFWNMKCFKLLTFEIFSHFFLGILFIRKWFFHRCVLIYREQTQELFRINNNNNNSSSLLLLFPFHETGFFHKIEFSRSEFLSKQSRVESWERKYYYLLHFVYETNFGKFSEKRRLKSG